MKQYDFYVAGRWRNKSKVKEVLDLVRNAGKTAYCFIENEYEGEKVEFSFDGNTQEIMKQFESMKQDDPYVRKIFKNDLKAVRNSKAFLLVLPAGTSGHIEAGIAFGFGKRCFAVGKPDKTESLYNIFEKIFYDLPELERFLQKSRI